MFYFEKKNRDSSRNKRTKIKKRFLMMSHFAICRAIHFLKAILLHLQKSIHE